MISPAPAAVLSDIIRTRRSVRDFLPEPIPPHLLDAVLADANWQAVDLDAGREGLRGIGHMGYFRQSAQPLWNRALDWFAAPSATPTR